MVAKAEGRLSELRAALTALIKPELEAKGDAASDEALKAKALLTVCDIIDRSLTDDWLGILQLLDEKFWQQAMDRDTQNKMINQLCNAAMKHRNQISAAFGAKPEPDPAQLFQFWPHYEFALEILRKVEERVGQPLNSNRQRLASVMNAVSKHSRWFVENIEAGAQGFEAIPAEDYARLTRISKASTIAYVDLYEPTLPPDTSDETWIALGNDLWSIGAKARALVFYERFLGGLAGRDDLKAYTRDPRSVVDPVGKAILEARGSYKPQWDQIRDLLVDAPDLMTEYRRVQADASRLKEKKVDYPQAFNLLTALREQMNKDRALLGDTGKLFPQVDGLLETVKGLAWSLMFKSRMVEAYMDLGQTQRAVELSADLIAYDPLYPPYMTVFVEGVLIKGGLASKAELKEAQMLAAQVRNMTRERPEMRMQYWTSACQVLELSILLGEIDLVKRTLQRYAINRDDPTLDLSVKGTDPRQARDEGDRAVWERFLRIYEAKGVGAVKPVTIETDAEGAIIAVQPKAE
jgi:tetratricopeptide (TPR) repeat protein